MNFKSFTIRLFLCFLLFETQAISSLTAQYLYKYRVYLSDKLNTEYSLSNPLKYLSQRAIDRRKKHSIDIDNSDIPISYNYIKEIESSISDSKVVLSSKWMNTVVVATTKEQSKSLQRLPFVQKVQMVWRDFDSIKSKTDKAKIDSFDEEIGSSPIYYNNDYYGAGLKQIEMLNGVKLHQAGFQGEGMQIAVLDVGFYGVPLFDVFENTAILGSYNFVNPKESVYFNRDHGTDCLSILGASQENVFIGTAPHASYWLFKTEDEKYEYPLEEDYWAAAAEYADSVGIDLISSSVGYTVSNNLTFGYDVTMLDGKSSFISQVAHKATQKGIMVVSSSGNDGLTNWKRIAFPADVENVLTVGAVDLSKKIAPFSSYGPTADGRIKPDVVAMGVNTTIKVISNQTFTGNGSSYSCPAVCGLTACLMEALPNLSVREIHQLIIKNADRYAAPDSNQYGYGIPDFYAAYLEGKEITSSSIEQEEIEKEPLVFQAGNKIYIHQLDTPITFILTDILGHILKRWEENNNESFFYSDDLKGGIYFLTIQNDKGEQTVKIRIKEQ